MNSAPNAAQVASAAAGRGGRVRTSATLLGLLLAWLVGVPLVLMVLSGLKPDGLMFQPGWTGAHWAQVFGDSRFPRVLRNTGVFVSGIVIASLAIGFVLAWLTERTDLPARRTVRALIVLPMAMPPMMLAVAWILLMSPRAGLLNTLVSQATGIKALFDVFTMSGMIFVQTLSGVPTAYLMVMALVRSTNSEMEEAARLSGAGFWRTMSRITLPILGPGLTATALFLAIAGIATFDIPGAIGMPVGHYVVSSQVYSYLFMSATGLPEYGPVSVIGTVIVAALLPLVALYHRMTSDTGRFVTLTGKDRGASRTSLGRWRWLAMVGVLVYFLLATVLPLATLAWVSFMPYQTNVSHEALSLLTFRNHVEVFAAPRVQGAAFNTLLVSVAAATLVSALSVWIAFVVVRMRPRGFRVLDFASFVPLALPGIILGAALTYVYLELSPRAFYGSLALLVVAFTTTYLTYGAQTMNNALMQTHRVFEDAGQMSGAGFARILRRISVPLLWPAIVGVWIWVFAHGLRELTLALMLQSERNQTIAAMLWNMWVDGKATSAAAVGIWLTLVMGVLVLVWQLLGERDRKER